MDVPPDLNSKPTAPPSPGAQGKWLWSGGQWKWFPTGAPTNNGAIGPAGIGGVAGPGGHPLGVTDPDTLQRNATSALNLQAAQANAHNKNPFGNELGGGNMQYTPFGLGSGAGYGSAFGGQQSPYARGTDRLVPNLEQIRMGYLQSLYTPFLGGK